MGKGLLGKRKNSASSIVTIDLTEESASSSSTASEQTKTGFSNKRIKRTSLPSAILKPFLLDFQLQKPQSSSAVIYPPPISVANNSRQTNQGGRTEFQEFGLSRAAMVYDPTIPKNEAWLTHNAGLLLSARELKETSPVSSAEPVFKNFDITRNDRKKLKNFDIDQNEFIDAFNQLKQLDYDSDQAKKIILRKCYKPSFVKLFELHNSLIAHFSHEQLTKMTAHFGGAANLEMVKKEYATLKELGFASDDIVKIVAHDGGSRNIEAVINNHAMLKILGFKNADIVKIVAFNGGSHNIEAVINNYATLKRFGFKDHRIVQIVARNGSKNLIKIAEMAKLIMLKFENEQNVCEQFLANPNNFNLEKDGVDYLRQIMLSPHRDVHENDLKNQTQDHQAFINEFLDIATPADNQNNCIPSLPNLNPTSLFSVSTNRHGFFSTRASNSRAEKQNLVSEQDGVYFLTDIGKKN